MSRIIQPPEIKGHPWIVRDETTSTLLAQVALERDARLLAEGDKILMLLNKFMSDDNIHVKSQDEIEELYNRIVGDK